MTTGNDIVLNVDHVSKNFYLPHEKQGSVKSMFLGVFKSASTKVNTQYALKDISLSIQKGEFFGILGRNGSGKSTLLKILAEIYEPTAGSVHHEGKLVPFIELGVGFNPELTGRENVYLNGALLGFSRKEIDERYNDIVDFAELTDFMDQKLKNYSSGMQVRLAFSVATRAEADILLVDEVLAVGDAAFQRKCFEYFKSLKKSGKTVIFVTHDMSAVREYCDRAVLIKDGLIHKSGDPGEVANEYLKLFNVKSQSGKDEDSNRWGDGRAKVEKIEARQHDGAVAIDTTVSHEIDMPSLVMGVRIRNGDGRVIAAFNTEGQRIAARGTLESRFTVRVPGIFGNGIYNVDVTLRDGSAVTICDNWDNAATLSILRNISNSESIVPDVEVVFNDR